MPHSEYGQIEITSNDYTDTLYETCGHDNCNQRLLEALGVGDERFTDATTFDLSDETDTVTVVLQNHMDEKDACAWCYGCGDFLAHGMSCDCKSRGHDPEEDREPLRPMVHETGFIALRPYYGEAGR